MRIASILRATLDAIGTTVGWHRLGIVACAGVILFSLTVLYRAVKHVRWDDVLAALGRTDPNDLMLAGICLAGVFTMLTLYDFFALRTIGRRDVPYRAAAIAGFTSFSIGHNIGAVVVASAAIRFRVYSAWGLRFTDVLKICFVTGLTFWLGNAVILGLAAAIRPDAASAVNNLPAEINRAAAVAALLAVGGYLTWLSVKPRTVRMKNFSLTLPGPSLTFFQIVIGVVDLTLCSLAMFFLLPDQPRVDFLTVMVVFVLSTLLGFASHSPSGLGVFDAAMLVGLQQFATSELLASLLLFRLVYYLLPLTIALSFLGLREGFYIAKRGRPSRPRGQTKTE
jgi:uncharacterized membrane protein YbhN (UPF0104 family)